MTYRHPDQFHR